MAIRVCVVGVTGWTGSEVAKTILASPEAEFELSGAIARRAAGRDVGELLGVALNGITVSATLTDALNTRSADVLVDFTTPDSVKVRTLEALSRGVRVVIGTSGLTATDFADIERAATTAGLGVIAAGNFSLTAALLKRFALMAAKYLPSREVIDSAHAGKPDAPSGTARELAEALGEIGGSELALPIEQTRTGVRRHAARQSVAHRCIPCGCQDMFWRWKRCSAYAQLWSEYTRGERMVCSHRARQLSVRGA